MAKEAARYGSLLMVNQSDRPPERPLPRDQNNFPYQVVLRLAPGGATEGVLTDDEGFVLGYVMDPATGRPAFGSSGPEFQRVPAEVGEAALAWWEEQGSRE